MISIAPSIRAIFGGLDGILQPLAGSSLRIHIRMPPGIPDIDFSWNPFIHVMNVLNGVRSVWNNDLNPLLAVGVAVDATIETLTTS